MAPLLYWQVVQPALQYEKKQLNKERSFTGENLCSVSPYTSNRRFILVSKADFHYTKMRTTIFFETVETMSTLFTFRFVLCIGEHTSM